MARTRQVRLEPDVVALLGGDDVPSLSAAANEAIRVAFGPDGRPGPRGDDAPAVATGPGQVAAQGRGGRLPARMAPGRCSHPAARRVGDRCGQCGRQVLR